jgi:hypothetical protein
MFFTIKSNVYTLRNFRISLQFSWRFLASPLLHAASHLPLFSLVSSLVFLVKVLVNKCPLYLRVLGLYSYRRFGVFSFFFMKKNLHPSFFSMAFSRPWKRKKWCIYSLILPNYTLTFFFFFFPFTIGVTLFISFIFFSFDFLIIIFIYFVFHFIIHSSFFSGFYI